VPGAWEAALAGIEACKRNGLVFQVHFSAQPMNYQELPSVIDWAHQLGAKVLMSFSWSAPAAAKNSPTSLRPSMKRCSATWSPVKIINKGMLVGLVVRLISNGSHTRKIEFPYYQATGYMGALPGRYELRTGDS